MKKKSILLIGYDEHLCLSIVYCLRKANYTIHLLTHNKKTVCRYSRFISKVFYYENYQDIPSGVARAASKVSIDLIMPYDEIESLTVSQHVDTLSKIAPVVPLTRPDLFQIAINKNLLDEYLPTQEVEVMPKSIILSNSSVIEDFDHLKFPILIKPSRSSFGRGIVTISGRDELVDFMEQNKSLEGFAAQEFIHGSDISCNVFAMNGKVKHYTVQESPVKQPGNYAKNDDLIFQDDPEVIAIAGKILAALHWNGVACIDLRRDVETGAIYLLEINGRFWGSVSSSLDRANVNFPLIMIQHALMNQELKYAKTNGSQISMGHLIHDLKSFKLNQLGQTKYRSYLYDPVARLLKYMPR